MKNIAYNLNLYVKKPRIYSKGALKINQLDANLINSSLLFKKNSPLILKR